MSDYFQSQQNNDNDQVIIHPPFSLSLQQIQNFNFQEQQQDNQQQQSLQRQQQQQGQSFQQNAEESQKQPIQESKPTLPPNQSSVFIKSSNTQSNNAYQNLSNSKSLSLNKFQAVPGSQKQVCYHWLKNKCSKGQTCEFLHSYIKQLVPICKYYPNCSNQACKFRHIDNRPQCQFYAKGFCRLGSQCTNHHIQKQICPNYALGFCPKGPNCQFVHPKSIIKQQDQRIQSLSVFSLMMRKSSLNNAAAMMGIMQHMQQPGFGGFGRQHQHQQQHFKKHNDLRRQYSNQPDYFQPHSMPMMMPEQQQQQQQMQPQRGQDHSQIDQMMTQDVYSGGGSEGKLYGNQMPKKMAPLCFRCGDIGHRDNYCHNEKPDDQTLRMKLERPQAQARLIHVTCKKCGEKGHYAHCCNKMKIPIIAPPYPINPQQMQIGLGHM